MKKPAMFLRRSLPVLWQSFLLLWMLAGACGAASTNGYVTGWGDDSFGKATPPVTLTVASAVAAGHDHSLALRPNGTVAAWGSNSDGQTDVPANAIGVRAIAAGGYHSLALLSNGTVVAWGQGAGYQTNVPPGLAGVSAIAAGDYFSMALRSNGTVAAWGTPANVAAIPFGLAGVSAIAAGDSHCVALSSNGMVTCWGGSDLFHEIDVPNRNQLRARAIAAGGYHSLVIQSNGTVLGWGYNYYGQASGGGLANVVGIAGGQYHSLALLADHRVAAWGDDSLGQTDAPSDLTNVVAISTTWDHNLVLRVLPATITNQPASSQSVLAGATVNFSVGADGGPPIYYQWRKNGQAISSATNATFALTNVTTDDSGTYSVMVSNPTGTVTSSNATLVVNLPPAITAQPVSPPPRLPGEGPISFSVAAAGTAPLSYHWRRNGVDVGPEGAYPTYTIVIVQPELAGDYTCVVTNLYGSATSQVATLTVVSRPVITSQPQSLTVYEGAVAVFHVGASNATLYQWRKNGGNITGANGPDYTISPVSAADAGSYTVMVSNDWAGALSDPATLTVTTLPPSTNHVINLGELSAWNGSGYVDLTPPAGVGNASVISLGLLHGLALLPGGTVLAWGDNTYGQSSVPSPLAGVRNLAAGGYHSLARVNGDSVVGWGANLAGQSTPPAASNIVAIAAGGNHSLGLRQDGTVAGWGTNDSGQASLRPDLNSGIIAIAAGFSHSLALRANGTVLAWGNNDKYQTRVPQALTNPATAGVIAIAAGGYHSLALRANGTVVCWGATDYGQTNVPPGLSNVTAIAAGLNHSLALRHDGTVAGWGANNYYQIEFPPYLSGVLAIAAGGNRSLLIVANHLVLLPPARRPGGGITLFMANSDGSAADASTLASLEVRATTNLLLNPGTWTSYTNGFVLTNGLVRWDDTNAAGLRWRFYRAAQR